MRTPRPYTPLTIALCTLLLAPAFGCNRVRERLERKAAEEALSAGSGGSVTFDDNGAGGITVKGKNGEVVTVGESKVPADWPKNVPLYPKAKVVQTYSATENGKQAMMVTMETADAADAVFAFYKGQLKGFHQEQELTSNGTRMLAVKDPATKRTISVIITTTGATTNVQVTTQA